MSASATQGGHNDKIYRDRPSNYYYLHTVCFMRFVNWSYFTDDVSDPDKAVGGVCVSVCQDQ